MRVQSAARVHPSIASLLPGPGPHRRPRRRGRAGLHRPNLIANGDIWFRRLMPAWIFHDVAKMLRGFQALTHSPCDRPHTIVSLPSDRVMKWPWADIYRRDVRLLPRGSRKQEGRGTFSREAAEASPLQNGRMVNKLDFTESSIISQNPTAAYSSD